VIGTGASAIQFVPRIATQVERLIARDNVDLVTERISRVTPGGVVTADGTEHPCDTLVLATGFRVSGSLTRMRITGRDGTDPERGVEAGRERRAPRHHRRGVPEPVPARRPRTPRSGTRRWCS